MTPPRRLFFALWPDAAWCSRLLAAASPLLAGAGGRALAAPDLHVTLCFLGAVDAARQAAVCAHAAQIEAASFELEFQRLELWREAGIVAATVARVPSAAAALSQAVASAAREAGLAPDPKPWRPHLTLMRGLTARRLGARPPPALHLTLPVARFYLAESQGLGAQAPAGTDVRRYAILASWPLRP